MQKPAPRAAAPREILALTGLRFVAALAVFVFHIDLRWPLTTVPFAASLISQGAVGMTVFFMLSGFILAYTYYGRSFSPVEFYRNRFARIYPIYVVAGLLYLPWLLKIALAGPVGVLKIGAIVFADTLMIQAWFPQLFEYWNNPGSWSLSAEAFFYGTFPFIFYALSRATRPTLIVCGCLAYGLSVFLGFVYAVFEPRPVPGLPIFNAMPIFRLPEFLVGICVFLAIRDRRPKNLELLAVALSGVLVAYLCMFGKTLPIYVLHNWLVVPTVAAVIAALARQEGWISAVFSNPVFVWLGKISYCFYSFQFLVIFGMMAERRFLPENGMLILLIAFVLLLALSAAGYHFVEEPLRKKLRSARVPSAVPAT